MAVDMFLELQDVTGETQDKVMKGAMDVLAWSWAMSQSGSTHTGQGGGAGKVNVQDLSITKYVDAASATLMQFCCQGTHIDKGTLTLRKAGGDKPVSYIVIEFKELIVSSIATGGSGGEDRFVETVSLNFREFDYKYKLQTTAGSGSNEKTWKWDIAGNTSE